MGLLILLSAAAGLIVVVGTWSLIWVMTHPPRRTYGWAVARQLPASPAEAGLRADETTFNFRDGAHAPAWLIDGARPLGPVFIVVHGWSSSRYQVLGRVPLLARFASRVVVYDLRGHGDSSARNTRMGTLEVQDLIAVIDQTPTDDRPIVLFGPSMGAGICIAAATNNQAGRVAGVIAESTYRHLVEPIAAHLRCRGLPTQPFSALAALYVEAVLGGLRPFDRAHYAAKLRCPLLVIHGSEDIVCAQAPARQIADAAPHGRFLLIQGAGHANPAEADESGYLGAIETFVNEITERANSQPAPTRLPHNGHITQQELSI